MENFDLVYVVDDDPLYIFSMKKVLGLTDFCQESKFFKNGQEALDDLIPRLTQNGQLPDVIFLDISMPLMNGWQFLDELKGYPVHHNMKIFIVSSSIDPYDTGKSASYDIVTDYIYKPITIEKMKELKVKLLS
jgi:CheY-like chemotaxis protein